MDTYKYTDLEKLRFKIKLQSGYELTNSHINNLELSINYIENDSFTINNTESTSYSFTN